AGMRKGPAVTDESATGAAPPPERTAGLADDFQPDVPEQSSTGQSTRQSTSPQPEPARASTSGRPPADYGGDTSREALAYDIPREPAIEAATAEEDVQLIPGATIAGGRYRLLVSHGGPDHLEFWQALDTALDRQVALTFVDPDAELPDEKVQQILSRTLKLS